MKISDIPKQALENFRKGCVIPAHPLSLKEDLTLDKEDMRKLANYYINSGVGGIAVGVHTTQFEIRDEEFDLLSTVLDFTSKSIDEICQKTGKKILKVSGICGPTDQAVKEAKLASDLGFHASLLSLAALKDKSVDELIDHCTTVAKEIPIIGFFLQSSVGGCKLSYEFWRRFAAIPNVLGIKMAPFNRYQTIDVVRGVCDAGKQNDITLYTGNDDNIVMDLLTPYKFKTEQGVVETRIKGGLLGHWCVWTKKAVDLLEEIHAIIEKDSGVPSEMLTRNIDVTDANGVLFDVANDFAGCIPGVHEVLRRQGLMKSIRCLNPKEVLSVGQSEELDRIYDMYPDLNDDEFVANNIKYW